MEVRGVWRFSTLGESLLLFREEALFELEPCGLERQLTRLYVAVWGNTSDLITTGTAPDVGIIAPIST